MMLLRSEMREEVRERRRNRGEEPVSSRIRDYEERVTYKTITRTEFQKRRASFESRADGGKIEAGRLEERVKKKTRSLDELAKRAEEEDPYHIQFQEKEMTEKLEDIHRMIVDMQEMTKQLKDRSCYGTEADGAKLRVKALGMISPAKANDGGVNEKQLPTSGPALTVKPVRYRSTIVIVIGTQWQRFKEEIELKVDPRLSRAFADGFGGMAPVL